MKNLMILFILFLFVSCKQNERLIFEGESRVYFVRDSKKTDTLFLSIMTSPNGSSFEIPVALLGYALSEEKSYRVEVVPEETTAQENLTYRLEKNEFIFPANTYKTNFPVILYKEDPDLWNEYKYLTLRLVPTQELGVAYDDRSQLVVAVSAMLKVPQGTEYFGEMTAFVTLFGVYSRKKHELIIEITGHDFWDGNYGKYGGLGTYGLYHEKDYYKPYARVLLKYVTDNEVFDENGNRINPW